MSLTPKIFISVPDEYWMSPQQIDFKKGIITTLQNSGFQPIILGEMGYLSKVWSLSEVSNLLAVCQGMIIIGSLRVESRTLHVNHPSEYHLTEWSHMEGIMARERGLPVLLLVENGATLRALLDQVHQQPRLIYPLNSNSSFLNTLEFDAAYQAWKQQVTNRSDVFFGYCSKAQDTAKKIKRFLQSGALKTKVLSWEGNKPGRSIYAEIERAAQQTMGGIFLFTKDDELAAPAGLFAPRDNVVFEAGLFAGIKGKERTLIILEDGAKLPSDLSNDIYAKLTDRSDISSIKDALRNFISANFG